MDGIEAGEGSGTRKRQRFAWPKPTIGPGAWKVLPVEKASLVAQCLALLETHARWHKIPVIKTRVDAYQGWGEPAPTLILQQWVDLPWKAVMDYWDALERPIQAMLRTLTPEDRDIVLNRICFEINGRNG